MNGDHFQFEQDFAYFSVCMYIVPAAGNTDSVIVYLYSNSNLAMINVPVNGLRFDAGGTLNLE